MFSIVQYFRSFRLRFSTVVVSVILVGSIGAMYAYAQEPDGSSIDENVYTSAAFLPLVGAEGNADQVEPTMESEEEIVEPDVLTATAGTPTPCPSCLKIFVDLPYNVGVPSSHIDTPVDYVNLGSSVRGYMGAHTMYRLDGIDAVSTTFVPTPAIGPSSGNSFDNCGAWITSAEKTGSQIRTWYHAERDCNTDNWQKSVGYAVSSDNGVTFTKPANNQIIRPAPNVAHEGDHGVIQSGDYYYMYLLQAVSSTSGWNTIVARASVASGGTPGNWTKYYNGSFSQPGLGGNASPLPVVGLRPMVYNNQHVVLFWEQIGGLMVKFGNIPVGPFVQLSDPLILLENVDWTRYNPPYPPTELVMYSGGNALNGGQNVGNFFVMNQVYVPPGEGFDSRYLLRRNVWFENHLTPQPFTVRIRLGRYWNANKTDYWETTAYPPGYGHVEKDLGTLLTRKPAAFSMRLLYDCYISFWDDHMVSANSDCEGATRLRQLGWVFTSPPAGYQTIPLWRCWNASNLDHYLHDSGTCPHNGQPAEGFMGYSLKFGQ